MLFCTACSSSKYSYKNKNATLNVAVIERRDVLQLGMQQPQEALAFNKQRGIIAPFFGKSVNFATQLIKKAIDNEQKKYIYQQLSGATDLFFYETISELGSLDPTGMQFAGLKIVRTFKTKNGNIDTAYIIELEVDTSDIKSILNNDFFHIKIKRADIRYAGAKVPGAAWYFPWTYIQHKKKDDKLNMDMEITFTSSSINENGEMKTSTEVGKFYLFLRDIPLDPKSADYNCYRAGLVGESLIGKCFLIPRSAGSYMQDYGIMKKCFSSGNYDVNVKVTESGTDKFVNKTLFENSDLIIKSATKKAKRINR